MKKAGRPTWVLPSLVKGILGPPPFNVCALRLSRGTRLRSHALLNMAQSRTPSYLLSRLVFVESCLPCSICWG